MNYDQCRLVRDSCFDAFRSIEAERSVKLFNLSASVGPGSVN